ncbi:MAG: response regulator transcription factor [Anaerolineae bacterium]|nr:response regulator transcription factor [Anaerolineae bacterium]
MYNPIRCLLIGASTFFWQELYAALDTAEDIAIVGKSASVVDARQFSHTPCFNGALLPNGKCPDIILLSVQTLTLDIRHDLQQIATWFPESKVIVLSEIYDRQQVLEALQGGAWGFLDQKQAHPDDIIRAICTVNEGGVVLDPQAAGWVLDKIVQERQIGPKLEE